jgi:predicted CXXCH cytochrome family protein
LATLVAGWALFAAADCAVPDRKVVRSASAARSAPSDQVTSNVLRSDYAGSRSCEPCHQDVYRAWEKSPMHRMTRVAETADIRAPFDGRSFRFKDDSVKLVQDGNERFVAIQSQPFGDHVYRVTRVIGGRYREDFAGVEVTEPRAGALTLRDPKNELVLPVTFVYSPPSFRLKGYSVMVAERPGLKAGGVWNQTCIFCHNTVPYFSSLLGELLGPSSPGYQGEVVDRMLPEDRRRALTILDEGGLISACSDERRFLDPRTKVEPNEKVSAALQAALHATRREFGAAQLVEVGIGCESCHGGSREHALDVKKKPTFEVRSSSIAAEPSPRERQTERGARAQAINRICARCHQVLFSRYPFTWEGGQRSAHAGGSHISSGEARDFLLGDCAGSLSCVACHDPHAEDAPAKLAALGSADGNRVCLGCHRQLETSTALAAHTHHAPLGAGSVCINCHMPRKNLGLGYNLTRYHRIGSPTETSRVEGDRPLECALCHVDKTVEQLVSSMERFWGKHYDRDRLVALYGDLQSLPLVATVTRGKPHEQATAIAVLGERRVSSATRVVASEIVNSYPLVRYFARQSLERMSGRACDVSLDEDDDQIREQMQAWLAALPN